MKVSKDAQTFYFTYALLKASRQYLKYLIDSKDVHYSLKQSFQLIINRIADLEKVCNRSLDDGNAKTWSKEFSERDFQVFASVFAMMNEMDEEKRSILEEFANQLQKGEVQIA